MTWWRTIIAVCLFFACLANAFHIKSRLSLKKPLAKSESLDDICLTPGCFQAASWLLENGNFSVDPCEDFYEFACGNVKSATIPDDEYSRSEMVLSNRAFLWRLKDLIEDIDKTKVPKHFGIIRTLYDNCMNEAQSDPFYSVIEYTGILNQIRQITGWPVVVGDKWINTIIDIDVIIPTVMAISFAPDPKDSKHPVLHLLQRSSGLDNGILRAGFDNDIVQAYYKYMVDVVVMMSADRARAEIEMKKALLFGISLANEKTFSVPETFHRITVGDLPTKYPKLKSLKSLIENSVPISYKLTDNDIVIVQGDFDRLGQVLSNVSTRVLGNWIWWISLESKLSNLSPEFKALSDRFYDSLARPVEPFSKWRSCVETVQSNLPLSLSALYQRKYISQDIVSDLMGIAANMKQSLYAKVQASWLDEESKREYLQKLENMISVIAYRPEYTDDKKLEDLYKNIVLVEGTLDDSIWNISSVFGEADNCCRRNPINRNSLINFGNTLTANAFYAHQYNRYSIGAPMTLKNYYHVDRPKYMNYATIGFVIAHEISHSIDIEGIHYDKESNVREWWSPDTKRNFDERVQCIINQYENFTVEELDVKLNGERLAAENIADNIGVSTGYDAYNRWALENGVEKKLPDLSYTPKQLLWISMGSSWCMNVDKVGLRQWVTRETHSPAKQRVNGAVANSPDFAKDFKCKSGTNMNPVRKCSIF